LIYEYLKPRLADSFVHNPKFRIALALRPIPHEYLFDMKLPYNYNIILEKIFGIAYFFYAHTYNDFTQQVRFIILDTAEPVEGHRDPRSGFESRLGNPCLKTLYLHYVSLHLTSEFA
jgi:hypothetical protein